MRMNIMRESQRMMLTQAETLVRLNQLRDEVIKALPPKNNTVEEQRYAGILQAPPVIPTSNAALEETLSSAKQPQTQVTMEEEVEGKRAPPTKVRSAPASLAGSPKQRNLMVEVDQAVKSGLSPRQVQAAAKAAKAAKAANKPSPTASQAPTVASSQDSSATSNAATSDPETPTRYKQKLDNLKAQVKILDDKLAEKDITIPTNISNARSILSSGNSDKVETLKAAVGRAEVFLKEGNAALEAEAKIAAAKAAETKIGGEGLKRHRAKSGRFVKSKR